MQFVDKAMNRALKWESADVTIPEMLDLIQTEILEKASDEELAQLKKGMQKTFALAVGNGAKRRYYPSFSASVRLCLEFHSLTHQLHSISLQDTVNKKEYFIPTGKASCTKLQSGVLRRMTQCGHGGKGAVQKPRYNDRYPDKTPERQNKPTYCRYCGEKLEHGASFCEKCGKPLYRDTPRNEPANKQSRSQLTQGENTRKDYGQKENFPYENKRRAPSTHSRGGKFAQKRRSPVVPILITVGCFAVCIAVGIVLWGVFSTDNISLVQNGYLGEYTDMTVRELFDTYYGAWGYNEGIWGEGTTNVGEDLVELRYPEQDELRSEVVIRFKMLDKECFCVYVFKDPAQEVTKATDLYRHLNWMYCMAYSSMHPEVQTDSMKELGLMLRLESISGSAVEYGASADYKGDRAQICEKAGKQPLEVNVALLLDNYGLIDLSKYYGGANADTYTEALPAGQTDENSIPPTAELKPEATAATEPSTQVTTPYIPEKTDFETDGTPFTGFVSESSGGLNIRNGPGRDYAQIGRLEPNESITIYEEVPVGTTSWGRIADGEWVCMDYIVISSNSSISMNADVLRAVVRGESDFFYLGTAENRDVERNTSLYSFDYLGADYPLYAPLTPSSFGVVDIDGNGSDEVIVSMDGDSGWYIVLHSFMGDVYGSAYGSRWLKMFKSGIACASSSASESDYFRLDFDGPNILKTVLPQNVDVDWDPIEMHDITEANIERYITK